MAIDLKLRKALTGISGILVTPFDAQDRVAPARLKPIIDRAVTAGVHILVINGNTSEFYGLTTAEAETMVHSVAEQIRGRVPLLGGVGRSIGDACALAKASRAASRRCRRARRARPSPAARSPAPPSLRLPVVVRQPGRPQAFEVGDGRQGRRHVDQGWG